MPAESLGEEESFGPFAEQGMSNSRTLKRSARTYILYK
jgi:hypothetical protein